MEGSSVLSALKVPSSYEVQHIAAHEFRRTRGQCYLDHAGAALYSEGQVQQTLEELTEALLGNPHSRHTPSDTATQTLEAARHRVLEHFNTSAEEYDLIFTSGATAALKLVAQHFDWNADITPPPVDPTALSNPPETPQHRTQHQHHHHSNDSSPGAFVYLQENHTSVLGMRGPAHEAGCDVFCLTAKDARNWLGEGLGISGVSNAGVANDLPLGSDISRDSPGCVSAPESKIMSTAVKLNSLSPSSGNSRENPKGVGAPEGRIKMISAGNDSSSSLCSADAPPGSSVCIADLNGKIKRNCLFAYSGQCNFSGSKAPLEWVRRVQEGKLDGLLSTTPLNSGVAHRNKHAGSSEATKWYVILDAASLVATCPLDLSHWKPDFVPVSFYKIFGYPTGLGCLLVHRRAWGVLGKVYQGGGTVLLADSRSMVTVPSPTLHTRFEDGTLPFLSIIAVRHGLDTLHKLTGGMHNIASYVYHLARYTHHTLASMRHSNGTPVAVLYQSYRDTWHPNTHGSIVNFNLLNPDGTFVGYAQVERVASLYNIHLRTGCLCNPGACQALLGISSEKLLAQFQAGHVCGDAVDLVDGEPTGSVRASFGYSSTYDDADLLLTMIQECFVEQPMTFDLTWMSKDDLAQLTEEGGMGGKEEKGRKERSKGGKEQLEGMMEEKGSIERSRTENKQLEGEMEQKESIRVCSGHLEHTNKVIIEKEKKEEDITNNNSSNAASYSNPNTHTTPHSPSLSPNTPHSPPTTYTLTDIVVYPVKSCGGVQVREWELGEAGLMLDRGWMVVTGAGATLTQKRQPSMALILPRLNLQCKEMVLTCEGEPEELCIPLDTPKAQDSSETTLCGGRVCGVRVQGLDCGSRAGAWLSRVLGMPDLRLMRQTSHRVSKLPLGHSGPARESLSLANESQYLVIHRPSVRSLLQDINHRGLEQLTEDELVSRFRGNLVLDGGKPYEEDSWAAFTINGTTFQVQGGCRRCQMVCVVPGSGQRTREPVLSLASARGSSMLFGVHALAPDAAEERVMSVGAAVEVVRKGSNVT